MASTITLANTITWAKSFIANLDPTVMTGSEPALTCANLVKMTILGAPFVWRWNRVVTGFVTAQGTQDYVLTTWQALAAVTANVMVIDSNGNCQQATTAGTTGSGTPTWNPNTNGTTADGSVTWTNRGSVGGSASSSYSLGFIETASVQDTSTTVPKWYELEPKLCLGLDSIQARPRDIAAQADNNAGKVTFRLLPTPNLVYPINITLQQKSALFAATTDLWAPFPDEYSYIYNWGFLTLMLLYDDDPRWAWANSKFVSSLLAAQQGLGETERNIFLNNWEAVTGQRTQNAIRQQQGNQARAM